MAADGALMGISVNGPHSTKCTLLTTVIRIATMIVRWNLAAKLFSHPFNRFLYGFTCERRLVGIYKCKVRKYYVVN